MAGTFRPRKFFPGYSLDRVGPNAEMEWGGDFVLATAIEATRRAIDDLNRDMSAEARVGHSWESRTGQTEAAVFWRRAIIETAPLRVWGEWGVHDWPRVRHHRDTEGRYHRVHNEHGELVHEEVTTKDVALFLEFGTVKMAPRPWLYPAWDANKRRLPELVVKHYREISASGAPTAIRSPAGRFLSHEGLLR